MSDTRLFRIASWLTLAFPLLLAAPALADIALCLIALSFLAHSARARNWAWCRERWVWLLGALWLWMCLRGLAAPQPGGVLARSLPFLRYIVFTAALARWVLADDAVRAAFSRVLSLAVLVAAGDGLIQYTAGYDLLLHPVIVDPAAGHIRLSGVFTRPILGIMVSWLAFPALLPLLSTRLFKAQASRRQRLYPLGAAVIILAAVALSGERMALLLFLLGAALALLLLRSSGRMLAAAMLGIVLLLGLLAVAAPAIFQRQVHSTGETLKHWEQSPYGLLLQSDLDIARIHPLLGVGAGQFRFACEARYDHDPARIAASCNTHPHNIYLEFLTEEGALGLVLFSGFVLVILLQSWRIWKAGEASPLFIGLFIAFVLRVWPFMSSTNFASRWGEPPFWLVLGGLMVYGHAGKRSAAPSQAQ